MLCYRWGDLQRSGVRDDGNSINVALVTVHELQMLDKRAEAVPSGKGRGLDQQSGQLALLANVGVYHAGNFLKIVGRKRVFRLQNQHANILEKLELDHEALVSRFFWLIPSQSESRWPSIPGSPP